MHFNNQQTLVVELNRREQNFAKRVHHLKQDYQKLHDQKVGCNLPGEASLFLRRCMLIYASCTYMHILYPNIKCVKNIQALMNIY